VAVQHSDHRQAQELFCLAGGNQHRKRRSVGCGAFLGVFLMGWRLLYTWRSVAGELLYIWPGNEGRIEIVTGKTQTPAQRDLARLTDLKTITLTGG
jgi:hypothetical protein